MEKAKFYPETIENYGRCACGGIYPATAEVDLPVTWFKNLLGTPKMSLTDEVLQFFQKNDFYFAVSDNDHRLLTSFVLTKDGYIKGFYACAGCCNRAEELGIAVFEEADYFGYI